MSLEGIKKAITKKTKTIIAPHMFGCPLPMDEIMDFGIPVIEDCAQAIGGTYKGKELGSYGDLSIFSFYATKMMTTGQGGMVLTDDEALFEKIVDLREFDGRNDYKPRYNYKLTDIQAAMGLVQLDRLDEFVRSRRIIARLFTSAFSKLPLGFPEAVHIRENVFFRYIVCTADSLEDIFGQYHHRGIEVKKPVHIPLHRYLEIDPGRFSRAEYLIESSFSIPIYPAMTDKETERIIDATQEIFST